MFIPEVFVNILRNLSRADLEAVQLAGPCCHSMVEKYFTDDGPLRLISAFKVRGQGRYRLEADSDAIVELEGSHELFTRLKSAFIEVLLFSDGVAMEESFLSALTQIKNACQIRRCEIRAFASSDVCERALGELQCEEIRLNSVPSPLENRLMSFTSVQHCRSLFMGEIYCSVDVAAVALWLHREKNCDTLPTLVLHEMNVNVHLLLNVLKEAFITAHESRSYELRIRAPSAAPDIEEVCLNNVDSSESLTIITVHDYFIIVERATYN
ncbi:hypothetical protein AAVH_35974 [Aphelenchoides avenae]|nr:hypothetical protein AAVH_35974 [Aphelenchus avenae]